MKTRKGRVPRPLADRFWEKVNKTEECWGWTGRKTDDGYGCFTLRRGKQAKAHRVSWELTNGDIPHGLWVLHKCDNPSCVRPDHLYVGTQQQNEQDKTSRGRHRNRHTPTPKRGLTAEAVVLIRRDTRSNYKIARDYGVAEGTIRAAKSGRTWGNIT